MARTQGKMQTVRPIIYVQSDTSMKGYGIADFSRIKDTKVIEDLLTPPYLILCIEPNEHSAGIETVRAVYNDGIRRFRKSLTDVQNVDLFLNSDSLKSEGSLADKVTQYLSFYDETDVADLTLSTITDTTGMIRDPTSSPVQMGVDAFVIGVAGYLAGLNFLLEDDVYTTLPFPFTLPFHTVADNTLNTNMFKYISYPCTAVVTHSTYCASRLLLDHILKFCNEWGPIFDEGPVLDFSTVILDTVSGYCKLTVSDLSEFHQNSLYLRDELANLNTNLHTSGKEVLETLETHLAVSISTFKEDLCTLFAQKEADWMRKEKSLAQKEKTFREKMDILFKEKVIAFRAEMQDIFCEESTKIPAAIEGKSKKKKRYSSHEKRKHRSRRYYDDSYDA